VNTGCNTGGSPIMSIRPSLGPSSHQTKGFEGSPNHEQESGIVCLHAESKAIAEDRAICPQ
jgi:hypothetical protein